MQLHTSTSTSRSGNVQPQQSAAAADEPPSPSPSAAFDPFELVRTEVLAVSERLRHSVVTDVPALETAADYFFRPGVQGKRLRPTLLLLMASALSNGSPVPPAAL